MTRLKWLILALIISSFFGYLEWGDDQHMFLIQAEYQVLSNLFTDFSSAAHPFTLIPLLGQLLLLIAFFQKQPKKWLIYLGIICLSLLLGLMLFIGISAGKIKELVSTLPFFILAILVIRTRLKS